MNGNQAHFGFRGGKLFVRALFQHSNLEYIPAGTFLSGSESYDLPAWLIQGGTHWLDLKTGIMQIRRKPNIWFSAQGNWSINLNTRRGHRREHTLVDPHSRLYKQVTESFRFFEKPENIIVTNRTEKGILAGLKRLELTFYVNRAGLLQTPQLQSEIDPNQNAGTLFGFKSMLVLRQVNNSTQRSIISPTGKLTWSKHEMHVSVFVITTLKRLVRMQIACLKGDHQRLLEDQNNEGHNNWNPSEYTDWLLLEIDLNKLIRTQQVDVANATISPMSHNNSVLQMNMGQGM